MKCVLFLVFCFALSLSSFSTAQQHDILTDLISSYPLNLHIPNTEELEEEETPTTGGRRRRTGEYSREEVREFSCGKAKGTYTTLLVGVFSVSLPSRVVILHNCDFLIVPAISYFRTYRSSLNLTFTERKENEEEEDISMRSNPIVEPFLCDLYPDIIYAGTDISFPSKNRYICGVASQKSLTGQRFYGRNFGVNSPWSTTKGLLFPDGGSCTVHSENIIKCSFFLQSHPFFPTLPSTYLYSAVLEKVSDDVDDDILTDLRNPKWSTATCGMYEADC